jgi:hypothetical protein
MKLADTLRSKCAAKGLGISGSTQVLFERLKRFEKKGKAKPAPKPKKVKPISKNVVKPKKLVAFKGDRLSAAYYFHEVCGGKILRCTPKVIAEKDGRSKLKEIKLVNGKSGVHPKWVLVKAI